MSHASPESHEHKPHVLPVPVYMAVWGGLLILTVVTVAVSYFNFGVFNLLVAMAVASVKAGLVVLFFMHLKYDEKFNAIVFTGCLAFLFTFFVLTLADTTERGKVDPLEARSIELVPGRPDLMGAGAHGGEAAAGGGGAQGTSAAPGDSLAHGSAPDSPGPGISPSDSTMGAPAAGDGEHGGGAGAGH